MAQQTIVIEVPGKSISELEPTSSVSPNDVLPVVQGEETKKAPLEQVADLVKAGLGSAASKNEEDFATPDTVLSVAQASQLRDDAQNERIDNVEFSVTTIANGTDASFNTYAEMIAYTPPQANVSVRVNADPDTEKNGTYTWNGSTYTKGFDLKLAVIQEAEEFILNNKIDASLVYEELKGFALFSDSHLVASTVISTFFIEVQAGDILTVQSALGDSNTGSKIDYAFQLDTNRKMKSVLFSYISTGLNVMQTYSVTAQEKGFIALRVRTGDPSFSYDISKQENIFVTPTLLKSEKNANLGIVEHVSSLPIYQKQDFSNSQYEIGYVINIDGTKTNTSDMTWRNYYIDVKQGDVVEVFATTGDGTTNLDMSFVVQLSKDKTFLNNLKSFKTTGYAYNIASATVVAEKEGYIYIRARVGTKPKILRTRANFMQRSDFGLMLEENIVTTTDLTNYPYFDTNYIYDVGGIKTSVPIESGWRSYFFECDKGDIFTYNGRVGSGTVGQQMLYIAQFDSNRNYISTLATYTSTGNNAAIANLVGTATQSGFVYVRARTMTAANPAYTIFKSSKNFASNSDVSNALTKVSAIDTKLNQTIGIINDTVQLKVEEALDGNIDQKINEIAAEKVTEIAASTIESNVAEAIANSDVSNITKVDVQLEKLPVSTSNDHGYNFAPFTQNNVVTFDDYQYVVVVDNNRNPIILQRYKLGSWNTFDLSTIAGNPFASPNAGDGHNNFGVTVTKNGFILITGNHHNNVCRCVISNNPHDISGWQRIYYTDSTVVTYPRFVRYPDGTTQAFWREGQSGDGAFFASIFDDVNKVFNVKVKLIDQASTVVSNPYEQRVGVASDGSLHLCWGYRTQASSANTNFGMFYAKSSDKGVTWTSASGANSYALPLNDVRSELIFNAPAGSGFVNQNGGCCDLNSRYHTVITQYDGNDKTQICHIWFDGSIWKSELVSDFTFKYDLSGPLTTNQLSRPLIAVTQFGKIFVLYRTSHMNRQNHIRCIDVSTPNAPIDFCLTKFNMNLLELSLNTDYAINSNELVFLLSRGAGDVENALWKNQSTYLLTAPLMI